MKIEEVHIKVEDNALTLKGWVYRPGAKSTLKARGKLPFLILCHGIPRGPSALNQKEQEADGGYPALARRCLAEGFPCFHFNFRGTGDSEGNFDLCGWTRDLTGVLDYWEQRGYHERGFYLWGFSAGAAVSARVASADPRVKAVALAACPAEFKSLFPLENLEQILDHFREVGIIRDTSFPVDAHNWLRELYSVKPIEHIAQVAPRPLLLIHGTDDELIPYEQATMLYEQAGDPKEIFLINGAGHQLRKNEEAVLKCLQWFHEVSGRQGN